MSAPHTVPHTPAPVHARTGETDPGKILFERFTDLWNGDLEPDRAEEFIADEITVHSAALAHHLGSSGADPNLITTRDGLLAWVGSVRTLLQDLRFTTDPGPFRDGDHICGGYVVTGTYAGGAPAATAAPGTPIRYSGMAIVRVEGDRLVEYWVLSDGLGLLSQLGAVPTPDRQHTEDAHV